MENVDRNNSEYGHFLRSIVLLVSALVHGLRSFFWLEFNFKSAENET